MSYSALEFAAEQIDPEGVAFRALGLLVDRATAYRAFLALTDAAFVLPPTKFLE